MSEGDDNITVEPTPDQQQPETPVSDPAAPTEPQAEEEKPPAWIEFFQQRQAELSEDDIKGIVHRQVSETLAASDVATQYNILVLYDDRSIDRSDADRIYDAVDQGYKVRPTLLVLSSRGGSPSAAYFIAKICREYSNGTFEVAVPRQAKSAATLICCGADKIHMGSLSELGPIDPQFNRKPALALKYSVEHLADLVGRYPAAAEMFANYLAKSLPLEDMGYYERVAVSTTHYAERLLRSRTSIAVQDSAVSQLANRLVYEYKDHAFAIDAHEALTLFSSNVVGINTKQYDLGNQIYKVFDLLEWIIRTRFDRRFVFTGNATSGCTAPKLQRTA